MSIAVRFKLSLGTRQFDINFSLAHQGITAIFGRSGAGKTTLINVISGLQPIEQGHVRVDERLFNDAARGVSIPANKRQMGYVFQEPRLFPHYSVLGNLTYGMAEDDPTLLAEIVQLLRLTDLLDKRPNALSGGEKQRVAIGRALLSKPKILLMDEPFSSLDAPQKKQLLHYLFTIKQRLALPIFYVSHSLDEIAQIADHLICIENGQVAACGPLMQVWQHPFLTPWFDGAAQMCSLLECQDSYPVDDGDLFCQLTNEVSLTIRGGAQELTFLSTGANVQKSQVLGRHQQDAISAESSFLRKGHRQRLMIYAKDVFISLERISHSSFDNQLSAQIIAIEKRQCEGLISLRLSEQQVIRTLISHQMMQQLRLSVGQAVFALIGAVRLI